MELFGWVNKIITNMQYDQENSFVYEQRNENFPESGHPEPVQPNNGIGKILAKYRNKQMQHQHQRQKQKQKQKPEGTHNNHHLSTVAGLNYSQLYNELKINKVESSGGIQTPRKVAENGKSKAESEVEEEQEQRVSRNPFNFQSALQIKNRKTLAGIIVHTPKNTDLSFHSKDQQQQTSSKKVKLNRFRISEIRDRNERRPNFHEVSDMSITGLNENLSQADFEPVSVSANTSRTHAKPKEEKEKEKEKMSEEVVLGNSRSIGVGNHRIDKRDLERVHQNESESNSPQILSTKNTPRYKKQPQIEEQLQTSPKIPASKHTDNYNPQKFQNIKVTLHEEKQKQKEKIKESQSGRKEASKVYSYQMLENVHIENKAVQGKKKEDEKVVYFQKQEEDRLEKSHGKSKSKEKDKSRLEKSFLKQNKSLTKSKYSDIEIQTEKEGLGYSQKQKEQKVNYDPLSIQVSRVASTIKPSKEQPDQQQPQPQLNLNDPLLSNPNPRQPHQRALNPQPTLPVLHPESYTPTFSLAEYSKIYPLLKSIQSSLKTPIINIQQILRSLKSYLQLVAIGNIDNIEEFDLPLHRKKIVKYALFLERLAMVVLAFCYVTHGVRDSLRFLVNMVGYGIGNCLILIKVLEESQVGAEGEGKKSSGGNSNVHDNSAFMRSDRLAMKRNLDTLRNNNNVLTDSIQKLSKSEQLFYENITQILKQINKSSLEQTFYSLLEYFSFYLCVNELDHMIPFLAVAPNPYLAPLMNSPKYTLVIDVVEIFCYGTKKSKSNVFRPYTQHFLTEMSQYYQLISFTSLFPTQVDKILDLLDPKGLITSRLYKHHTINTNNQPLKYLDRIGRNLDEMILLDNENLGGMGSFQNCIHVPVWRGGKNDTVLAELCPLLAMIALKRLPATDAVRKVREQTVKNKKEGVKYINFGISLD